MTGSTAAAGAPATRRERRALVLCSTGVLMGSVMPQFLVPALAVAIGRQIGLSVASLGLAVSVSFGVSALASAAAGGTVRRLGVGPSIVWSTALAAGSSLLASAAGGAAVLVVLLAVNGLGNGMMSPALSSVIATGVERRRHGSAFGLLTAAPQIAAFAAGICVPLAALTSSWRWAFAVPVAISLVSLAGLWRLGALRRAAAPVDAVRDARPPARLPTRVHLLALAAALASAGGIGLRAFVVVFLVARGLHDAGAGLTFAAAGLLAVTSRIVFGALADRRPHGALAQAAGLMALSAAGLGLMAVGGLPLVVVGALVSAGVGWGWQAPLTAAVVAIRPHAAAAATGLQMAGFFSGAVIGPLAVGVIATDGRYARAWAACAGLLVAAAALTLVARGSGPGRAARDDAP